MRKIALISYLIFAILVLTFSTKFSLVFAQDYTYARIKENNSYLYKTANLNENIENKIVLLSETYFVKILTDYNEYFYKVEYGNLTGYVKKIAVDLVNETPKNPFPFSVNFKIKNNTSCYLRSLPKVNVAISNVITIIPSGTNNLPYLGRIIGEEAIDLQGTIWYLTEYNGQLGYVYSYYSDSFLPEHKNTEVTTLKVSVAPNTLSPLTNSTSALLIVAITAPLLLILVLLYKAPKAHATVLHKKQKGHSNILETTKNWHEEEL